MQKNAKKCKKMHLYAINYILLKKSKYLKNIIFFEKLFDNFKFGKF